MDTNLVPLIRRHSRRLAHGHPGGGTVGTLPRRPRALFFDVYGTLFHRLAHGHARSQLEVRRMLRSLRVRITPGELEAGVEAGIAREHARMKKDGVEHPEVNIQGIWGDLFPSVSAEEVRRAIVLYECAMHPCWPMPGCRRLLHQLSVQGYELGIISNAQFYTPLFFAALLGGRPEEIGFSSELCFYSWVRGRAKPGPEMFQEAAGVLGERGIAPRDVLMVGNDPVNDIDAGARAGFMTVRLAVDGVSTTGGSGTRRLSGPDATVTRLTDISLLLESAGHVDYL